MMNGASATLTKVESGEIQSGYRLDIQGLRAIAVIVVVAFHAGLFMPGGFVGVDVFFVISGFVITGMLQREWQRRGRIRLGRFYLRRFQRLTPALALTVFVTILFSCLFLSPLGPQQDTAAAGSGAIFLSANVVIAHTTGGYFDAPAESNPLLHTWSLSLEEQFYLLFPLVLTAGWYFGAGKRLNRLPGIAVAIFTISSLLLALGDSFGALPSLGFISDSLLGYYGLATRAWEFGAGALLILALPKVGLIASRLTLVCGVLGSILLAASLWLISSSTPFPGISTLLPVVGTVLLLAAGSAATNPVSRLLSTSFLVKIGDWSYSIYLWHWPCIVFARMIWDSTLVIALAAVASIVPAYASYRWVENPIRALRMTTPRSLGRIVGAVLIPPVALSAALSAVVSHAYGSPKIRMYQSLHVDMTSGCDRGQVRTEPDASACTWNSTASGTPIYLVGDSNAGQLSEAVIGAGNVLGRPVAIVTRSSCPLLDGYLEHEELGTRGSAQCRSHNEKTIANLTRSRPGVVLLAATDRYWLESEIAFGPDRATATTQTESKLRAFEASLSSTVLELQKAGHRVLLVHTIPRWMEDYKWRRDECSTLKMLATRTGCGSEMPLRVAEVRQGGPRGVIEAVATRTGAAVLDLGPIICPDGVCAVQTDDLVRMRDDRHITVAQSEALSPTFARVLSS